MNKSRETTRKSLDEHLEAVQAMARLSFYVSWNLQGKCPDESLEHILRERSPLYSITLGLDPYEIRVPLFQTFPEASDADDFEEKMFRQCKSFLISRGTDFYPCSHGMGIFKGNWQAGCLRYDPPKAETPQRCGFHICNSKAPGSIFGDPTYLPQCLLLLAELAEKEFGVTELSTSSWLNDAPKWMALFPKEYHDNIVERSRIPQWHAGYWGQIINARGLYNEPNGAYMRKHNELRFHTCFSFCSISNLRNHLKGIIA